MALEPAWSIRIPAMLSLPHASATPFPDVHAFRTAQRHVHATRELPTPSKHSSHASPHCLERMSASAVVKHRIVAARSFVQTCRPSVHAPQPKSRHHLHSTIRSHADNTTTSSPCASSTVRISATIAPRSWRSLSTNSTSTTVPALRQDVGARMAFASL